MRGVLILGFLLLAHLGGAAVASEVQAELERLSLLSVDTSSRRAVLEIDRGELLLVEPGDSLLDGRARVETVTTEKLALRYRVSADQSGAAEEVRVWIHRRVPGELRSRIQVLWLRHSADAVLPIPRATEPAAAVGSRKDGDEESSIEQRW